MALKKILKKFIKNFFLIKDNTLKLKLIDIIEGKEFVKKDTGKGSQDLKMLTDSVLTFYADMFQKGSKKKARWILDAQHNKIRTTDAAIMTFFVGATLILLIFFIFFLALPQVGTE